MAFMNLLAIDTPAENPISTAGFAWFEWSTNGVWLEESGVVDGGFAGFIDWWHTICRTWLAHKIVVEHYVPYNKIADSTPMLAEGLIRGTITSSVLVLQPSSVLQFVSDDVLKRNGWWKRDGHHRDANSAIKHGLAYLRSIGHRPTLDLLT